LNNIQKTTATTVAINMYDKFEKTILKEKGIKFIVIYLLIYLSIYLPNLSSFLSIIEENDGKG